MNYKGNNVECLTPTKKHIIDTQLKKTEARRAKAAANYISMRMEQLAVERDNPNNNAIDSEWYNRIIQELDWAQQAINKTTQRNCFMETNDDV
tara:strand:+ start:2880 stop:3158 length:279 start_codon:yes stop_codon:yes gene_type:complete